MVAMITLLTHGVWGQVNAYNFSQTTGTYTPITGGTVLASGSYDDGTSNVSIPFTFLYNNIGYTQLWVSCNGYLGFGTANDNYSPISSTATYAGAIVPWGADANGWTATLGGQTAEIRTEVTGTAPNRQLVVQWRQRMIYSTSSIQVRWVNYQVRLQETTNIIEMHYGASGAIVGTTNQSGTAQIGLRGATNADYINRTNSTLVSFNSSTAGTTNASTQAWSSTTATPGRPTNGLIYKWSPPAPPACSPPTSPLASMINFTSANVSWNAPFFLPSDGYEYAVTTSATPPASGTLTTATSATVTGLPSNTNLFLHVRSNCGASGNSSWVTSASFQLAFCTPVYTSGISLGDLISNVQIVGTTLSNNSGTSTAGPSYTFFTGQPNHTADLLPSTNYQVNVTVGTWGNQHVRAWIDYNDNGLFEASEVIGQAIIASGQGNTGPFPPASFAISLACTPPAGIHRMRIRSVWNDGTNPTLFQSINPCTTYGFGETEDYLVNIVAPPACPSPGVVSGITTNAFDATVTWATNCASSTTYDIEYGPAGFTQGTGTLLTNQTVTITGPNASYTVSGLTSNTNYTVYYRANCGGTTSAWSVANNFTTQISCFPPTALTISNLTATSATGSWTAPATAPGNGYEYAVTTSATAPTSGTATTNLTEALTGLTANTTYFLHVRSICGASDLSTWANVSFFTGYCQPTGTGLSSSITNVVTTGGVTNISNTSTFTAGGYADFTAVSCSQIAGSSVNFTLSYLNDPGTAIYIDWNNDLDFTDAGERVYNSAAYVFNTVSGTFTVPSGQAPGNYRMRVVADWDNQNPVSCPVAIDGEIEDYTFTVAPPPPAPTVTAVSADPACQGQSVTISGTDFLNVTGVTFGGVAATSYTVTNATTITAVIPMTATSGNVEVTTGSGSGSLAMTINVTPAAPTITLTTATFCGTGGATTATASGSTGTYTWTAVEGNPTMSGNSGSTINVTVAQTSAIEVIGTGAACPGLPGYASIGVLPLPGATMTSNAAANTICTGGTVDVNSGLAAGNFSSVQIPHAPRPVAPGAVTLCEAGVGTPPPTGAFGVNYDDGGWGNIPLGFTFDFFGTPYSTINIGTNGNVMFGTFNAAALADFTFTTLPNTAEPFNMVAVLAMDNDLRLSENAFVTPAGIAGAVRYWTEGYAPNRRFVVSYENVREFGDNKISTSQAIFYEATGVIEVHVTSSNNTDRTKVVGVNNGDGTIGVQALATTAAITTPVAYRFTPPANYTTVWFANGTQMGAPGTNVFTQTGLTPTAATTYSIDYTNQSTGCSNTPGDASIVITVNPIVPAGVSISTANTTVCDASSVTFTATPVNGGTAPTYVWMKNGTAIAGQTAATYVATAGVDFVSTDVISCEITSNAQCLSTATATSNSLTMTVDALTIASVFLSADNNPVCNGDNITFTASPTNGGSSPTYVWKKNGVTINGVSGDTYSAVAGSGLADGDVITVEMTSNATPCLTGSPATSNGVTIGVNVQGPTNTPGSYTSTTVNHTNGTTQNYVVDNCVSIGRIRDLPGGNTPGSTTMSSTVLSTVSTSNPLGYVYAKRSFSVSPASHGSMDLTFFMTQEDFDDYNANAANFLSLPTTGSNSDPNRQNVRVATVVNGVHTISNPVGNMTWNGTHWVFTITRTTASGVEYFVTSGPSCANVPVSGLAATNIQPDAVTATWTQLVTTPTNGWYALRYRVVGANNWTNAGTANSSMTSRVITGLTPGTDYEMQIRWICSSQSQGDWSSSVLFTTTSSNCATPMTLNTPTTTSSTLNVTWTAVSGAAWYEFQYKETSSSTWISAGTSSASATSRTISGLSASTSYDVRGRTFCSGGSSSAWSAIATGTTTATTDCALPPVLTLGTVTNTTATFTWPAVPGAAWFEFRYKLTSSSTWISAGTLTGTATSRTLTGLTANTQYDFQARTFCVNGNPSSAWSATRQFTTTGAAAIALAEGDVIETSEGQTTKEMAINEESGVAVNVFPNPTHDVVNVQVIIEQANETLVVRVFDMSGRLVQEAQALTEGGLTTIPLSMGEMMTGVYNVELYQNGALIHRARVQKN
jgi:hypothetical protein